ICSPGSIAQLGNWICRWETARKAPRNVGSRATVLFITFVIPIHILSSQANLFHIWMIANCGDMSTGQGTLVTLALEYTITIGSNCTLNIRTATIIGKHSTTEFPNIFDMDTLLVLYCSRATTPEENIVTRRRSLKMLSSVHKTRTNLTIGVPAFESHPCTTKTSEDICSILQFKPGVSQHRRGTFNTSSVSVSFGGGQKRPGNLRHPAKHRAILDAALATTAVKRVIGFQNASFATSAPKAHHEIQSYTNQLFANDKTLRRNSRNTIYPAMTFNCGPRTVCLEHVDHGNAPNSMCAITAFGNYNPKAGGHIILVDLKPACEVPPGSTILILSGVIAHANTPVQEGEERGSLTQFCAGSIKEEFGKEVGEQIIQEIDGQLGERWKRLLGLFSKFPELEDDRKITYPKFRKIR
ncbi:hypothetical protein BDN72DRAFT_866126, partial [Pluteus cervinus]